jgi:hypothetical protein
MSPPTKPLPYKIDVDPIKKTISVSPNAGHGRHKHSTVLQWSGAADPFILEFFTYDSGKATAVWPFVGNPDVGMNGARTPFERALKPLAAGENPPAYTYSVSKAGYQKLDPIIIVDD